MNSEMKVVLKSAILASWVAALLVACSSSSYPPRDNSTLGRINAEMQRAAKPAEKSVAPVPEAVNSLLLPPPSSPSARKSLKRFEQRFDLVISDTPIEQVLMGLVADTPYSIVLKPKTATPGAPASGLGGNERITLSLRDTTLFKALDAIRETFGYDYTVDGNVIFVQPPELQTRLYQIDYVIGQRRGVSDIQVIGGPSNGSVNAGSTTATTTTTTGSGGTSSFSSVQASALSTLAKTDLWGEIEDSVRTALGCQIPRNTPPATSQTSTSASQILGSGSRADVTYRGESQTGERQRGVDGCSEGRALTVNQMSGTLLVRGMPNEHRMIARMLRSMQLSIERQVIIEAKIIDVELNDASQQGINWALFHNNLHRFSVGANSAQIGATPPAVGAITAGTSVGGLLGAGMLGVGNLGLALNYRNFVAMVNFLKTQGTVHVLSSPRISTLNSQKAVIKVGSEEPFVTNITGGSVTATGAGAPVTTPPVLNYQPFFSGIAFDVTPHIDEQDNITLHVHSMVNSVVEKQKISLPVAGAVQVPFAVNTINETDNVIKTKDGSVVVIGGLMTDSNNDTRSKVPGLGDVPGVGAMFSNGAQTSRKRELVILLKPTIVKDESAWTDDIAAAGERIGGMTEQER